MERDIRRLMEQLQLWREANVPFRSYAYASYATAIRWLQHALDDPEYWQMYLRCARDSYRVARRVREAELSKKGPGYAS